jgi:formate/nitrite transporter FocA (FNT family)
VQERRFRWLHVVWSGAALAWNIVRAALGNILGGFLLVVVPFWICFGSRHSAMPEAKEDVPYV